MSAMTYTVIELRRSVRNRRFFAFSLVFPIVFYVLLTSTAGGDSNFAGSGITAALFYLTGLGSFGVMAAMIGSGARISAERANGWNRQLRLTPLKARNYLISKLAVSYLVAILSLIVLSAVAIAFGARLPAGRWLEMVALMLIGAIPFAGLGLALGHLLSSDTMGPVIGTSVGLLAFIGGTWFPLTGTLKSIGQWVPSYWIAEASRVGTGSGAWSPFGWSVITGWSVLLGALALWAYRRDTKRA